MKRNVDEWVANNQADLRPLLDSKIDAFLSSIGYKLVGVKRARVVFIIGRNFIFGTIIPFDFYFVSLHNVVLHVRIFVMNFYCSFRLIFQSLFGSLLLDRIRIAKMESSFHVQVSTHGRPPHAQLDRGNDCRRRR